MHVRKRWECLHAVESFYVLELCTPKCFWVFRRYPADLLCGSFHSAVLKVETRLSCRSQTHTTRCLMPVVLYTEMDVQCDKLATDDRRHLITPRLRLS